MSETHFIPETPAPITRQGIPVMALMILVLFVGGNLGWYLRNKNREMEEARRQRCVNNLKHIGLALHNYHSTWGSFPPAYTTDATGKPMHSWRVLILPYLEQDTLYKAYNMAEPWDGPNNRKLLDQRPNIYGCPTRGASHHLTSYVAIVGPKTVFPGSKSRTRGQIIDGADQTIAVAEVSNVDIAWTEPRDLDAATMSWIINDPSRPGFSNPHDREPMSLLADGSVRLLGRFPPAATLKAMTTVDGGEPVARENPH